MQKIQIESHLCLVLNHRELIESLYKQQTQSAADCYALKPEIFNFKPKAEESAHTSKTPKRKRKRKAETENEQCETIKLMLQPFLESIKTVITNKNQEPPADIPRVWENLQEFPQFRGANSTNQFQVTQFHQQSYIIPPNSKFYNYNVDQMPKLLPQLEKYDIIIMDMPWQNKYIKRLKKVKESLAYKMLDNDNLKNIPLQEVIHHRTLVALWCTNATQHRRAIEEHFLPHWNLKLVHTLKWFKLNTKGELIGSIKSEGYKQPYELLYIACYKDRNIRDLEPLRKIQFIASVPSIIHSHKPPIIEWLKEYLDNGQQFKGLEIFARYLQPQVTSIGLEVIKLMDSRLYNKISS